MPQALEQADGRWAWVVLLASLVTQALTASFPSCIGVFFTDLQHDFQATNSETSWFPSIMVAMLHGGGEQPGEGERDEGSVEGGVDLPDLLGPSFWGHRVYLLGAFLRFT